MDKYIDCGSQRIRVRSIPSFEELGAVPIDPDWRIIDLETMAVIGPPCESYGLLCAYAEERYKDDYN